MLRGILAVVCLSLALLIGQAAMADIYVAADIGNDTTGDGSQTSPYRTVTKYTRS